jgi:hypothetical protein
MIAMTDMTIMTTATAIAVPAMTIVGTVAMTIAALRIIATTRIAERSSSLRGIA